MQESKLTTGYGLPATVGKLLAWAENQLEQKGITLPRLEAEHLLAHCLGLARWRLCFDRQRTLTSSEGEAFRKLLVRRGGHYPLAYILGRAGFYNVELSVDGRALVPRPETELLVEQALALLCSRKGKHPEVLDLGCGCGAVALAIAAEEPDAVVYASDVMPEAVGLARQNARELGLSERIHFEVGDLFDPWRDYRPSGFDLILSNPPYLSQAELEASPPEVREYEPRLALDGGPDGLNMIRRLIEKSPDYLKPGGWLLFEIGAGQGRKVRKLIENSSSFVSCEIVKDYAQKDRVVVAQNII